VAIPCHRGDRGGWAGVVKEGWAGVVMTSALRGWLEEEEEEEEEELYLQEGAGAGGAGG